MENILVSIRVRPLSKQEASKGNPWKLTPKSIALSSGASISGQTYNFDRVFDPNSKTVDIYDAHTKKIISSAVQGFNGTIFAYGQTSSGKTYTMRGTSEEPGIIPLAIQDVFRNIELDQTREFLVRVSYMEIYNEEIKDLLAPENCKLQIHENLEKGIFVAGLREEIVVSTEHVLALMDLGEAHRHVGETNMNVHSSRSHAIFRMVIESRDRSQDQVDPEDREMLPTSDPVRVSHLNLVDLAGSERVAKTGAEGARLKEGTHINKSLMTLGNVINKLSEGIEKQGGHVPYRDSKLTRILQPALGGNARTVIICNITPALVHVDESKGTLQFASRANRVTNCAQVNEIVTDAALLKRQKKEIAELRQKLQNQESPSDQFEEEILNLRNELLKTELERERMALELQEFQKAQAERERRIKEQEQKIENLSTMVINSAVDDREFEKRSKRSNRRETWCARPQSGLPLLPDVKRSSQKDAPKTPKTASSGFPIQINRGRSFGLPPPFEALMEEDEDTFTSCSFGFQERLSIDDGFTLPEPGPQSSVADRRRRPSDEDIVGNELEQQLSDLQGQYDTLQCDYIIKMNEKDSELDKLKRDLAYTQMSLSKSGKDSHNKVQDPEKRGKSLDGWKESESLATIKQLRAQVRNLETEKLYMERELHRLSDQAREQNDISRQELDEVYEELNLAKETCAKLSNQLGMTLQEVQQLQTEKRENEVLFSQLSSALKDLKTELDDIRQPCGGLQSSINESLQHLTIHVKAFQECLADARDLSALGQIVNEHNNAKFLYLTSEAASSGDFNFSGQKSVELDEIDGCNKVTKSYAEIVRNCANEQQMNAGEKKLTGQEGVQSLHWSVEDKLYQSNDGKESRELAGTIESEKKEDLQSGDHKDCEIKHCYSVSVEQKPGTCIDFDRLEEERHILRSGVDDLRMQIEQASSEKQSLLQREAVLRDELDKLKACIQVMGDEKSNLSETNAPGERNSLLSAVNSLRTEIEHSSSEKQTLLQRKAVLQDDLDNLKSCLQEMEDERSSLTETDLHEKRNNLLAAVDSLHLQIDLASSEKQGLLQKKAVLQHELDNLKTCLEVMEDEKSFSETKLHGERNSLLSAVDSLQTQIEQASSEKEGLLPRQALLQDELDNLKSCLQVMEQERSSLSEPNQNCKEGIAKEHQPCRSPSSLQFPESEHVRRGHAADSQATLDESLQRLEAELSKLKEENNSLSVSLASVRGKSEWALLELQTSALRESVLRDKIESLKAILQSVEEERNRYMKASDEAAKELGRLETVVEKLAMQLAAGFEKCDRLYETSEFSGVYNTLRKFEFQVDCANDELKSVCEIVETLLVAVKQAASEENRLLRRESALSEELHHVKSSLQSVEDKNISLAGRLEEIQGVLLRESAFSEELHQVKSSLLLAEDENTSLTRRLEEIQGVLLRESAFSEELHQVKASLQSVEDENTSLKRRLEQTQNVSLRESALSEELQHVKSSLQLVEDENTSLTRRLEEAQSVVQMVSALSDELHHMKSSLQSVEDEKESLKRRLEETQSELDCRKAEMNAIASKVWSSRPNKNGTEEQEELSEIESLIKEKETLEERVDILHADVLLSRKEIDRLSSREASLEEEATSLKLSVEEKEDDKKLWMKIGEERLADIERQKAELLSIRKVHADAQKEISDLNSLLSEKLDEVDKLDKRLKLLEEEEGRLNKKLKDVEEEKNGLIRTADELDNQLQSFRAGAAEALKEMEGWQQRYQTESTHYRAEITSLRKELSAAKNLPGALTKERDGLHRDLEKTKSKMKDIEAKLKTTIQDKSKLETEKVNMDRELKQLRQSTMLQRDISRRDSIVDQRRQSIVLGVNKTKNQLSSVEHALQLKTEELENLTYELSRAHESYAKLEFAMAEAESYSNEKVAQLEEALATLKDERDAAIARLQNEMGAANEQFRAKSNELTEKLQESEGERTAATALAAAVTKEKEDIVEELLDAHISFQRQKAELTAEAQENREKSNRLNQDIVLLTEELQKLKKLQEEASDANKVLQDQLQQALETNTEKSLTHHKLVKELEAEVESYKEQCRELQQHLQSAQKQAHDLRFCGSQQLEELRLELQQSLIKLSTAKDEEQMLLTENRSLLVSNTKLQFALDASRDRLEIFEDRSHESDWELTEFKSLLQKAGFVRGNQWNLASLQQFAKHVKAQNNEARRLETELASRKMEMIDLELQLESNRAQCDKYQEEIQYLKTKVLTPEQETGVREIVVENKKLKAQLKKTEEKAQELHELVKGKEVSLNTLQGTLGSIHAQNAKLQKDLAASKAELESLQQLHKILLRAGAIAKSSTMSSSKPVRPEKLEPKATSQSSRSLPSNLFQDSGSPVSMAESACTESNAPGCRLPLSEKSSNESPRTAERKRARLFPASERSKLSRSLGLGPRYFTLPESRSHVDLNKENFTLY